MFRPYIDTHFKRDQIPDKSNNYDEAFFKGILDYITALHEYFKIY